MLARGIAPSSYQIAADRVYAARELWIVWVYGTGVDDGEVHACAGCTGLISAQGIRSNCAS